MPLKILILKPSSLGDVVLALPVMRLLRQHHPGAEIHWWLDRGLVPLLEGDPDLAGIIPFDRRRWSAPWRWGNAFKSIRHMRGLDFDWVLDLQSLARSGLFAWLSNGDLLVGLDDPREGARGFYDIAVPQPGPLAHAVDWYLEVLRVLEVPVHSNFEWMPERPATAGAIRRHSPDDGRRWVALLPGARWANKRWPAASFARLIRLLAGADPQLRFVVLGSPAEAEIGRELLATGADGLLDLVGRTTLPEMVEWIRRASVVVANDSGPMHVAAALGRPVVAMFGPTEPRRTGPYGQLGYVLQAREPACIPCMRDRCDHPQPLACLNAITPERVARDVLHRLGPAQ